MSLLCVKRSFRRFAGDRRTRVLASSLRLVPSKSIDNSKAELDFDISSDEVRWAHDSDGDAESTVSKRNTILAQEQPRQDATALDWLMVTGGGIRIMTILAYLIVTTFIVRILLRAWEIAQVLAFDGSVGKPATDQPNDLSESLT
ncbi:Uncharacterized protein HZ326_13988 [Fusarium oxysporum f. sp. albedinis]|nr:Uncharacterized protein HZ326_13988 [Fusarium oxysporum f. sp. albedinis]